MEVSAIIRGIIFFTGGVLLLIYHSPNLIFLSVLPLVSIIYIARLYGIKVRKDRAELSQLHKVLSGYTLERFKQIRTVKLFSAEHLEINEFNRIQEEISKKTLQVATDSAKFFAGIEFFAEQILLIGGGVGVFMLKNYEDMSIGNLTLLGTYGMYSGIGFRTILASYAELKKTAGLYSSIALILTDPDRETIRFTNAEISEDTKGAEVILRNLTFTYPGREIPAVSNVSLHIRSGEIVGVIGPSGHGKSTLLHLITMLYVPDKGEVLIDGINILTKPTWWVRDKVSIVSQEALLFSGTIADNVSYSNPSASTAMIKNVLARADALEFIENLPENLNTKVGESGTMLSGGQRQRICIARALLKNPQLLILDEATSGVDMYSESLIQQVIEKEVKHKGFTVIIVTHRATSLKGLTDKIIIMEKGQLAAYKAFEELVEDPAFCGLFKV